MVEVKTSCYRNFKQRMGQPVTISLGLPKWLPEAAEWPKVRRLTPKGWYLNADDATFEREYIAQLDRYGVASIRQRLEEVAAATGAQTLVLLCHEADGSAASCHRGMFREWAARHGWTITEAESGGRPPAAGEFRTRDADGRQLVVSDGRWTYAWSGEPPLAVGDRIVVPFGKQQKAMTVTALGTVYAGPVREVEGRQEEL